MENFENIKKNLIKLIQESADQDLILKLWNLIKTTELAVVSEPQSLYESEKPMTEEEEEEVEEYFHEEEKKLPDAVLRMIERGLDDVKDGRVIDNEEVEKYFEEWLED